MAETKTNSKKKTTSGAKKAAPKQKKPTKKELEQLRLEEEAALLRKRAQTRQIAAVALFFSAVLLFVLSAFGRGRGSVYNGLHNFHLGVWGFSAYVFPILTVVFAYFLSRDKEGDKPYGPYLWSLVMLAVVLAIVHIIGCKNLDSMTFAQQIDFEYKNLDTMGGALGAALGGAMYLICRSKALSVFIYVLIALAIIALLTKTTVQKFVNVLAKPVRKVGAVTGDAVRSWKEAAANETDDEMVRRRRQDFQLPDTADGAKNAREKKKAAPQEKTDDDGFADFSFEQHEKQPPLRRREDRRMVIPKETKSGRMPVPDLDHDPVPRKAQQPAEITAPPEKPEEAVDMFATINAMEQAANELNAVSAADVPFALDAPAENEGEKIKLDASEFEEAKQAVADEISENAAAPVAEYKLPPLECLNPPVIDKFSADRSELKATADKLISALESFKVEAQVVDIVPGPSVTRYELKPAAGVKISKFTNLSDDLALHLAAPAGIRIDAPIPNKSAIGIEVPNRKRESVYMRELIDTEEFRNAKSKLNVALGKDITGKGIYIDIAKMPHLLVAGTTGSGKSVCLNSMLVSILYNAKPSEVKLLLIDPKSVEFSVYNNIPHLLVPVVSEPRKAAGALGWAVTEMLNRYNILNTTGTRDIESYNQLCEERDDLEKLPQIVIFIDELSDLMSVAPSEVEDAITRLAQMARAAGMHLVVATQRPSVDVITGLIKANIPSRIALSVSSQIDSRTILDASGAEKLLGNGDMLVAPVGKRKPTRVQGCWVSDPEVKRVVDFVKSQETGVYSDEIQQEIDRQTIVDKKKKGEASGTVGGLDGTDELMMKAVDFIVQNPDSCSISSLQRKLGMGFSKAGRLMDMMEEQGIVGPHEGSKGRKVLISKDEWYQMKAQRLSSEEE